MSITTVNTQETTATAQERVAIFNLLLQTAYKHSMSCGSSRSSLSASQATVPEASVLGLRSFPTTSPPPTPAGLTLHLPPPAIQGGPYRRRYPTYPLQQASNAALGATNPGCGMSKLVCSLLGRARLRRNSEAGAGVGFNEA